MKNAKRTVTTALAIGAAWSIAAAASVTSMMATAAPQDEAGAARTVSVPTGKPNLDRSGHKQVGKASFYASSYAGKKMADGTPMSLYSNNAASTTLPLGTTARVTNLETGRSAVVTIRDRGPYVKGRIVDLSPATARSIGIARKQGLAKVELIPLTVPQADGSVKIAADALASN